MNDGSLYSLHWPLRSTYAYATQPSVDKQRFPQSLAVVVISRSSRCLRLRAARACNAGPWKCCSTHGIVVVVLVCVVLETVVALVVVVDATASNTATAFPGTLVVTPSFIRSNCSVLSSTASTTAPTAESTSHVESVSAKMISKVEKTPSRVVELSPRAARLWFEPSPSPLPSSSFSAPPDPSRAPSPSLSAGPLFGIPAVPISLNVTCRMSLRAMFATVATRVAMAFKNDACSADDNVVKSTAPMDSVNAFLASVVVEVVVMLVVVAVYDVVVVLIVVDVPVAVVVVVVHSSAAR